jgi:hypothetical protein
MSEPFDVCVERAHARESTRPPALIEEHDDRFVIGASTIPNAGRGLFARVALEAGARLEVVGVRVTPESAADQCSHYTDRYKFRVNGTLLIPLGYGAMVNHAIASNVEQVSEGDRVFLRTRRPIAAGEELLLTYGPDAARRLGSERDLERDLRETSVREARTLR